MYKNGQTDKHKRKTNSKYPTLSVGNAGPPDTTYLYYSHVEGVTLNGSLLPA